MIFSAIVFIVYSVNVESFAIAEEEDFLIVVLFDNVNIRLPYFCCLLASPVGCDDMVTEAMLEREVMRGDGDERAMIVMMEREVMRGDG